MTTKDLLSVGVVLSAKDMYHGIFDRAKRDLRELNADAKVQAQQFEKSLTLGKGLVIAGGTAAVVGAGISRVFEDVVRTAGEMETNLNDVLIAAGDQPEGFAERTDAAMNRVRSQWAVTDAEIAQAVKEIGGRTRDYEGALEAVGVAASLARARKISLAEATSMLTTRVQQQTKTESEGRTMTERYQGAAAELAAIQKALGSNSEILSSFMGRMAEKTGAAGIEFKDMGALLMEMGRSGTTARAGMQPLEAMLDAMRTLPEKTDFRAMFPTYSKRGGLVNMLTDVKTAMDKLPTNDAKLRALNKAFGAGAEMVLSFTQNLDGIEKSKAELELAKYSDVAGKGAAQMETWAGTQAQATATAEQFKEMVGGPSVRAVMGLQRGLIDITRAVNDSPFWRGLLGPVVVVGGLLGELAKIASPVIAAIGWWKVYHTQQDIAIALQKQLGGIPVPPVPGQPGGVNAKGGTSLGGNAGLSGLALVLAQFGLAFAMKSTVDQAAAKIDADAHELFRNKKHDADWSDVGAGRSVTINIQSGAITMRSSGNAKTDARALVRELGPALAEEAMRN